jgi:hypothetical protein
MTRTLSPASAGTSCGCGCGGTDTCELHALIRPRFFCGQLLTDQDLSVLTEWAIDRRKLGRYRDGWGVVCGLDVGADPAAPGGVVVQSGYAVSSCGEDIVLPARAKFDVSSCCPGLAGNCGTPSSEPPPDTCVVDLAIAYQETGTDPILALGRTACGETGDCENSRTVESYRLVCKEAVDGSEPDDPDWRRWKKGYAKAVSLLERAQEDGLPGQASPDALRSWLGDHLREQPPAHFGFLTDWVTRQPGPDATRFAELLFWIVQDRILAFLAGGCPPGCAGEGVPLARIWLAREETSSGQQTWVVRAVDPGSPYRHEFASIAWPAPLANLNLARAVWHRPEDACLRLQQLGVPVNSTDEWSPSSVDDVIRMVGSPPLVSCHESVCLRYVTLPQGAFMSGQRVVGFACDSTGDSGATGENAGESASAAPRTGRARVSAKAKPEPKPASETRRRRRTDQS